MLSDTNAAAPAIRTPSSRPCEPMSRRSMHCVHTVTVPAASTASRSCDSPPLSQLRDAVLAAGTVTVCTQCIERRDIGSHGLLEGVRIAGAAAFVSESMDPDSTALVY